MKKEENKNELNNEKPTCGIIMPISPIDGCSNEHWNEVKSILSEAIESTGYCASLVSDADDSGIIQKRIVQNIYDNEIVVCDVSGKNPNVMFELGMRLAFDKPTIIVIDDKTNYSFDTAPIEHLSYPRDLRYFSILKFKEKLKDKISATIKKSKEDPHYTTFLKHFGEFEIAHVEKKEGSLNDVVLSRLDDITHQLSVLQRRNMGSRVVIHRDDPIEPKTRARDIIRNEIERFCKINNVDMSTLFFNKNGEKDRLVFYLEEKSEIRDLCGNPDTLRNIVDDIVVPF
jgi:hypothetical protein